MALALISHDLEVVAGLADRILVMYAGRIDRERGRQPIYWSVRAIPTPLCC